MVKIDSRPLLSIAIPTHNRCESLKRLLCLISKEIHGYEDLIEIIVSDNGSKDHTREVLDQFKKQLIYLKTIFHPINLGMDHNFMSCFKHVRGSYVWFIGDDDLPVTGFIPKLLQLLEHESPDLLYLRSKWFPDLQNLFNQNTCSTLKYRKATCAQFAAAVNVWTTFLSGLVVRYNPDVVFTQIADSLEGSKLIQLSWVLDRLKNGIHFLISDSVCVLATSGNTGGYSVVNVFGNNFPAIVKLIFSGTPQDVRIAKSIIIRSWLYYMPGLIFGYRRKILGSFDHEELDAIKFQDLDDSRFLTIAILPLVRLPLFLAFFWLKVLRLFAILLQSMDYYSLIQKPLKSFS
jgi:abequosyltransferase